jgi:hypothetical protein
MLIDFGLWTRIGHCVARASHCRLGVEDGAELAAGGVSAAT